jgi:hypothetical protein
VVRWVGDSDAVPARIRSWSPDGAWLLVDVGTGDAPAMLLVGAEALGQTLSAEPTCTAPCEVDAVWGGAPDGAVTLWLAWQAGELGCVEQVPLPTSPDAAMPVSLSDYVCEATPWPVHPSDPVWSAQLVDQRSGVLFYHRATAQLPNGVYALPPEGGVLPVALLPDEISALVWSDDGNSFVARDSSGSPVLLGVIPTRALWDAREVLVGADDFTWRDGHPE